MFLAGFGGTGEGLLARSLSDISLAQRLDRLIASGESPPVIGVFPDCMSSLVGTQFLDSKGIGDYGSHVALELAPFLREEVCFGGRLGLAGRSSGGYGALRLVMDHPGVFDAVACHAGDMAFSSGYCSDLVPAIKAIRQVGSPRKFVDAFWKKRRFGHDDFAAMNILCMSAAYSPDEGNTEFPARLPICPETGNIDFNVFLSWSRHDPLEMIELSSNQQALKALKLLFVDAGDRDEYLLHLGARRFVEKLRDHGVEHIYEEFSGGHRGTAYRYDRSIPLLVRALMQ